MTRTDGEHELVLGNKQLLSAFFVVVILLGVFFTMGYFVGRNTASSAASSAPSTSLSSGIRPDAAGKPIDSGSVASVAPPPETTTAASPDPNAAAPASTAPAVDEKKAAVQTPAPAAGEPLATPSSEQMYLQVFALRRPDADAQVKVLRNHGFPALLGESSKEGIYRVLVGPFKTTGDMARMKADLKSKTGFDSIVAK